MIVFIGARDGDRTRLPFQTIKLHMLLVFVFVKVYRFPLAHLDLARGGFSRSRDGFADSTTQKARNAPAPVFFGLFSGALEIRMKWASPHPVEADNLRRYLRPIHLFAERTSPIWLLATEHVDAQRARPSMNLLPLNLDDVSFNLDIKSCTYFSDKPFA